MRLDPVEARVVGSLLEKELTTPQQYPLTLNALVAACNQTSNRDPVVDYDESTVAAALDGLKSRGLVRFVHPSHGRSVVRYRQVVDEVEALDAPHCAVLAVLLLRGPQTVGELRSRTDRMASFDSLADVEHDLRLLADRDDPLVAALPRRPGHKEERWVVIGAVADAAGAGEPGRPAVATADGAVARTEVDGPRAGSARASLGSRPDIEALRAEVDALRADVARLAAAFDELRRELGD